MANEFIARNGLIAQNNSQVTGSLSQGSAGNISSGTYSHAEGISTIAAGGGSHAEGYSTQANSSYAHSEGYGSIANGASSHAEGANTAATGIAAHAEGDSTQAIGDNSHAEGSNTQAIGTGAHAEGRQTYAKGEYSHAEGDNTTATGTGAHAEGLATVASGSYSHTEGASTRTGVTTAFLAGSDVAISSGVVTIDSTYGNVASSFTVGNMMLYDDTNYDNNYGKTFFRIVSSIFDGTRTVITLSDNTVSAYDRAIVGDPVNLLSWNGDKSVSGDYAHTEGSSTYGLNSSVHAEGTNARAAGYSSHVEGYDTTTANDYAHAEGNSTIALGPFSHTEGALTKTFGNNSHAEGISTKTGAFGYNSTSISSGVIYIDSSYGDVKPYLQGINYIVLYDDEFDGNYGSKVFAVANYTSGAPTMITLVDTSVTTTRAYIGSPGTYQPTGADRVIPAYSAHVEGSSTFATGFYSHTEGASSQAAGIYSHAEGDSTIAMGVASHAEGLRARAVGDYSHAEGRDTYANGDNSHAEGSGSIARALGSHAEGLGTVASGSYQHVQGTYNISSSNQGAWILGNGTSNTSRSNLIYASGSAVQITGSLLQSGSTTISGSLSVNSTSQTMGQFVGNQNGYVEFSVRNSNTGVSASGDIVVYANNGTALTNYIDMGINNSGLTSSYYYGGTYFGGALDSYLYNVGGNLRIGNATSGAPYSQSLYLFSNATGTPNIWITGSQVAINKQSGSIIGAFQVTGQSTLLPISASSTAAILVSGSGTVGGANYIDFIKVTNTAAGATNINTTFRKNNVGSIEMVNSAYTNTVLTITDSGSITTQGLGVTMPNRPAFRVVGTGASISATTTISGSAVSVDFNQGSYYSTSTGKFTAPIAGLYQVNVVCRTAANNNPGINQIIVRKQLSGGGATTSQIMVEWAANTSANHMGGSTICNLAVGDTLWLDVTAGTISFDGNDNFSAAYIG